MPRIYINGGILINEQSMNQNDRISVGVLAGTVDYGTSSITSAYLKLLDPVHLFLMTDPIRQGGGMPFLRASHSLLEWEREGSHTLCLFNAPILLGGYLPHSRTIRRVAILDWTADCPMIKGARPRRFYDGIYRYAFSRFDCVATPSDAFASFYSSNQSEIREIEYPLPYPDCKATPKRIDRTVRVLFVGADYKRKGGDLLLDRWSKKHPRNARLTFVCPDPPQGHIDGVDFLRSIQSVTAEHEDLFKTHHILILPSHNEPFGYVLLEAINFGISYHTTKIGCFRDCEKGWWIGFGGSYGIDRYASFIMSRARSYFESICRCVRLFLSLSTTLFQFFYAFVLVGLYALICD